MARSWKRRWCSGSTVRKRTSRRWGTKFKYTGYEDGDFDGIVPGSFKYTGPLQGVGYCFQNSFHIYKDELKPEKK
jgi:hypothetical protein